MKCIFDYLIKGWNTRSQSAAVPYSANRGNIPEDMIILIRIVKDLEDRIEKLEAKNNESN